MKDGIEGVEPQKDWIFLLLKMTYCGGRGFVEEYIYLIFWTVPCPPPFSNSEYSSIIFIL